ncbi:MAG: hypothetical protein M3P32_03225 [Chloroflexota bacterium]|nr:hypothetical protein [Chloroflexota bacterium]
MPPSSSPSATPETSLSDSFPIMPATQPADFTSPISCSGPIGATDPVAAVHLHGTEDNTLVLRDYADPGNPRTVCDFGQYWPIQILDARHVVIGAASSFAPVYAVVDLPEVRYHWFQLPTTSPPVTTQFLAVSPGLDQIAWMTSDLETTDTDVVHITTLAGDKVIATLVNHNEGRCGTADDSSFAGYTRSGNHLFVLDQPYPQEAALLVVEGETLVFSVIPPAGDWPFGANPAMAVWSPTSETLYYRQGTDVWKWAGGSTPERWLTGVTWYYPTISADGRYLAYVVMRPDGFHDAYLVDLAGGGSPEKIGGGGRNQPVFVNATQLWYRAEGPGEPCGPSGVGPLIYNVVDGSESSSIIDFVFRVWPATSSNW